MVVATNIIINMIVRARSEPGKEEMVVATTKESMVNDDYHDACTDMIQLSGSYSYTSVIFG